MSDVEIKFKIIYTIIDGKNEYYLDHIITTFDDNYSLEDAYREITILYCNDQKDSKRMVKEFVETDECDIGSRSIVNIIVSKIIPIEIYIKDGLIQNISGIPNDTQVEIHDYDIDAVEKNTETDKDGNIYNKLLW